MLQVSKTLVFSVSTDLLLSNLAERMEYSTVLPEYVLANMDVSVNILILIVILNSKVNINLE